MTFTIKCPQCGTSLGGGYHSPQPDGKEQFAVNLLVVSDPPVLPQADPPSPEQIEGTH